jgi:multicomponent Na+:H+ antiporter subunit C
MTAALLFSTCGAILAGIGAFAFIAQRHLLRRVLAFNVIGSGIFLMFGGLAFRLPEAGTDPVPQAMVITGIVVAVAATAFVLTLVVRLYEETGREEMPGEGAPDEHGD